MEWAEFIAFVKSKNIAYTENESVAARSSFKVGGRVRLCLFPDAADKLKDVLMALRMCRWRYEIIGNASNILFAFDCFDGVFVFTGGVSDINVEGNGIYADCGASLISVSRNAADNSLTGLEFVQELVTIWRLVDVSIRKIFIRLIRREHWKHIST